MGIVKDFNITFGTQIFIILAGVVNSIILTRTLGATGQGVYALSITTAMITGLFISFGLSGANTYWVKRHPAQLQSIYSNSIAFSLATALVLFSFYMFTGGYPLNYFLPEHLAFIIMLSVPFLVISELNLGTAWGLEEISRYNFVCFIKSAGIVVAGVVILVILRLGIREVIFGWLIVMLITAMLSVYILRPHADIFRIKTDPGTFLKSIRTGFKSFSLNLIWFLFMKSDIYLVKYFLAFSDVGYYSIAILILEMFNLAPQSIGRIMFNKAVLEDIKNVSQISQVGRLNFLYSILVCAGMALFGKYIIVLLFGRNFIASFNCFYFLIPAVLARNVNIICSNYINGKEGISVFLIYSAAFSLAASIGLNLILIPRMGIVGAAITASVVSVFQASLNLSYFLRKTKVALPEFILIKKDDLIGIKNRFYTLKRK